MKLKQRVEDFRVRELLIEAPQEGRAPYRVYRVTKRKLTSIEAARRIAQEVGVTPADVSMAGLKDRQGVTIQHMAVHHGPPLSITEPDLRIESIGYCSEKLTSTASAGNAFELVVRGLDSEELAELRANLSRVREGGIVNYFDDQRFGNLRHNQGWIALDLMAGEHERALRMLLTSNSYGDDPKRRAFKRAMAANWGDWSQCRDVAGRFGEHHSIFEQLKREPEDFAAAFSRVATRLRLIHLYAFQSHIWNRAVAELVRSRTKVDERVVVKSLEGPLVFPPPTTNLDDHPTFRLPGPQLEDVENEEQRKFLTDALATEGLVPADFEIHGVAGFALKGEDRPLIVRPQHLRVRPAEPDKLNRGLRMVRVRFELPRGAYATLLVRRLLGRQLESSASGNLALISERPEGGRRHAEGGRHHPDGGRHHPEGGRHQQDGGRHQQEGGRRHEGRSDERQERRPQRRDGRGEGQRFEGRDDRRPQRRDDRSAGRPERGPGRAAGAYGGGRGGDGRRPFDRQGRDDRRDWGEAPRGGNERLRASGSSAPSGAWRPGHGLSGDEAGDSQRGGRPERGGSFERHGGSRDRNDRGRGDDRPRRGGPGGRGGPRDAGGRSSYGDREARGNWGDRPDRGGRPDSGGRGGPRDDRSRSSGTRGGQFERRPYSGRDERPRGRDEGRGRPWESRGGEGSRPQRSGAWGSPRQDDRPRGRDQDRGRDAGGRSDWAARQGDRRSAWGQGGGARPERGPSRGHGDRGSHGQGRPGGPPWQGGRGGRDDRPRGGPDRQAGGSGWGGARSDRGGRGDRSFRDAGGRPSQGGRPAYGGGRPGQNRNDSRRDGGWGSSARGQSQGGSSWGAPRRDDRSGGGRRPSGGGDARRPDRGGQAGGSGWGGAQRRPSDRDGERPRYDARRDRGNDQERGKDKQRTKDE